MRHEPVFEGSGTFVENGQRSPVGPGDVRIARNGCSHGLENTSAAPLRILFLNTRIC